MKFLNQQQVDEVLIATQKGLLPGDAKAQKFMTVFGSNYVERYLAEGGEREIAMAHIKRFIDILQYGGVDGLRFDLLLDIYESKVFRDGSKSFGVYTSEEKAAVDQARAEQLSRSKDRLPNLDREGEDRRELRTDKLEGSE